MKNLTFFIVMLFSIALSAQNFPADKPEMLLNKEVKVLDKDSPKEYGYADFYKDKELDKVYACCQKYNAKYEKLVNRVFKVTAVEPVKGVKSMGGTMFLLTLQDAKETIYFNYNSKHEFVFPFEVIGGLPSYACNLVAVTNDADFDFYTAAVDNIAIMKQFDKADKSVKYFLRIVVQSTTLKKDIKTANIMMDNSKEISRTDANVTMKVADNGQFEYTTDIELTSEEVALLKNNKVYAGLISTFDTRVTKGTLFKELVNCLESK